MGQRAVRGRVEEGHGVPEAAGSRRRGVLVPRERFGGDERRRRPQRLRHVSDTPVMMVCAVPVSLSVFSVSTDILLLVLLLKLLAVSVCFLHLQRSLSGEPSVVVLLPLEHHGSYHGPVALPKLDA